MTSKIKVDNINKVSDDSNIIKKCGTTVTVGAASDGVRTGADNLQAADGGNLISQSGTTITLGASGDTIQLAGGANQTGFGRTGTVDWQTGSIKTSTFTAANGEGYFANTSGSAFVMNLPAGSAGNIVSVVDYTNTFQTNNLTVTPNGSQKIGGVAASAILNTQGQSVTFVYVDDTEGWKNVQDSSSNVTGVGFVTATGGTITTSGNCKIHTFTGPGTFCVSDLASAPANNRVSYLVVAGGGSGGPSGDSSGGGGAGGFRESQSPTTPYTTSPKVCAGALSVTATGFPITVGGGGGPGSGSNSIFSTITSAGGGVGGGTGTAGGSGGGGGSSGDSGLPGGAGNTPPVSPSQGNPGGTGRGNNSPHNGIRYGGGGGGIGGTGGSSPPNSQGIGGVGVPTSITGSALSYAGGAGAGEHANATCATSFPNGSPCGTGGTGSNAADSGNRCGTANRGGGGGGGSSAKPGIGYGGSGIVVIRYKFQ